MRDKKMNHKNSTYMMTLMILISIKITLITSINNQMIINNSYDDLNKLSNLNKNYQFKR